LSLAWVSETSSIFFLAGRWQWPPHITKEPTSVAGQSRRKAIVRCRSGADIAIAWWYTSRSR
jgi:hypothetical protein